MTSVATRHYRDEWTAIDTDTYDGFGSPIGVGRSEADAIADLKLQMEERAARAAPATEAK
jgi:hypothetical protein